MKSCLLAGGRLADWLADAAYRMRPRSASPAAGGPTQPQSQVSSLSGLAVTLLALVVFVIFWATSSGADNSAIISFFAASAPTQAPSAPSIPVAPPATLEVAAVSPSSDVVAFSIYNGAHRDIVGMELGQHAAVPLVSDGTDARDPVWSPDGQQLAYASRRDGNWELYVLDTATGQTRRLTYDLAYEAAPSWSPDGLWLAYEASYQGNLDIYILKGDGTEGPYPVTSSPAPDYSPVWSPAPDKNELAYVSLRTGNADVYILSLSDPAETRAVNVTNSPNVQESAPQWTPDGARLAYSAVENGTSLVYTVNAVDRNAAPAVVGQGHSPSWSPDGARLAFITERAGGSLLTLAQIGAVQTSAQSLSLPGKLSGRADWSAQTPAAWLSSTNDVDYQPAAAYKETLVVEAQPGIDPPYRVINLQPLGVSADSPHLSDRVDGSFYALKEAVRTAVGWDVLGQLDSMFWEELARPAEPGQTFRNWHKAGRAFDLMQSYNQNSSPQIELVPEYVGPELYWRLYVRCGAQDGSCGEPMRQRPWDFQARFSGDVDAYENGGRLKDDVPSGYYVDFTQLAELFGWERVPSASSWRYNWTGVLWWHYEKRASLDWWTAMRELYAEQALVEVFGTAAQSGGQ